MIDPVWASAGSKFAILIGEWLRSDRMINIVYSEELNRPSYEEAIDHVFKLTKLLGNIKNIGVDASQPELIVSLKKKIGERYDSQYIDEKIKYVKKYNLMLGQYMLVCLIGFHAESRSYMSSHSKKLLDDSRGLISINEKHSKLITALRGAQFDETYKLDKDSSPHNDLLDCFQMFTIFFKFKSYGDY
jgi:hypothetical protein